MKQKTYYIFAIALIAMGIISVAYYTLNDNSHKMYGEEMEEYIRNRFAKK